MICNCTGNCMRACSNCYKRLDCSGVCTCSKGFYLKIIEPVIVPMQFPDTVFYDDDIRWYNVQDEDYEIKWDDSKNEKCPAD